MFLYLFSHTHIYIYIYTHYSIVFLYWNLKENEINLPNSLSVLILIKYNNTTSSISKKYFQLPSPEALGKNLRKSFITFMISVVLGEYKISFFSPFRKTSFGWNGGHIVGLDIVSFFAIRRMQTRITANTMGITISKTVTHTFLF